MSQLHKSIWYRSIIFCHAFEKWEHGHCAKVSKEQIELLEQIEGAMLFCDKCRYVKSRALTGLTEFKAEIDQKMTAVKDLVKQTIAKHDETTENLLKNDRKPQKELLSKYNKRKLLLLKQAMPEHWDKVVIPYKLAHKNT